MNALTTSPRRRIARRLGALSAAAAMTLAVPALAAGQTPSQLPDLKIEELMGVSIQSVFGASERLQPVTEAPASVTIVTADEIRRYGYRTLGEILGSVRGFFVTNDRNYSYVGIRGFGRPGDYNARLLLLVNGHRVNDNVYDQAAIGTELGIDVAMFDRVEVIRGPASSLYGTSAFFAVVNVITRSGASTPGAAVEVEAGTLGSQLARGSFGRRFANGMDVAVSGTFERSHGIDQLYMPAFDSPDTNHGVAQDLDGEQLGEAYARFGLRDWTITGTFGSRRKDVPTASFDTLFNSQSPREQTIDTHAAVDAQYDHSVGRTRIAADVFYDRASYGGIYPFAGEAGTAAVLVNSDGFLGARWGAAGHATRPLPGRQTMTAGGEFIANVSQNQWSIYDDPSLGGFDIDQSSKQSAAYLQDEIKISPWLLVSAGIRYDHYEYFAKTTPRGALIVTPSANQSFKYLYGQAFRAPNAYELYYFGNAAAYLQPESIATHELVWEQYAGEWLRTSASVYRYDASQLLALRVVDTDALFGNYAFVNEGTARAKGVELEGEVRTKRAVQLLASYARQTASDETNSALTNSPEHMAKLRFSAPTPWRQATASFEIQHLSSRRTLTGAAADAVTIANATVTGRLTRSFGWLATVRNLFGEQYGDPASAEHLSDVIPQNGRTLRVGFRWAMGAQ
jgi:outer membrane receptor for ferrienterochelin and colicins